MKLFQYLTVSGLSSQKRETGKVSRKNVGLVMKKRREGGWRMHTEKPHPRRLDGSLKFLGRASSAFNQGDLKRVE